MDGVSLEFLPTVHSLTLVEVLMPFIRGLVFRLFAFLLVFCAVSAAFAQSGGNSGTVSGTVDDGTGAVVPGARVSIENPVSGYTRTTTTDQTGHYQFSNVPFNPYHL